MYILSIDTSAKTATVCLSIRDDETELLPVSQMNLNSTLSHSESLLPMISECLSLSGKTLKDVSAIAVSAGPGSFTGIRIGIATVKGLAMGLEKSVPCIPVSTLSALAANLEGYPEHTILCPVMDARRNQVYNALFAIRKGRAVRLCDDRLLTADELYDDLILNYASRKIVLNGDGAKLCVKLFSEYREEKGELKFSLSKPKDLFQNAFSVALCGERILRDNKGGKEFSEEDLSPVYLRASQAERERAGKTV